MKRNRILRLSCYLFLLGFGILLCLMPACNLFKDNNEEKPPETEEDPPETEKEDEEEPKDPPETEKEDEEDTEEDPPETEKEDEEESKDPPETEKEDEEDTEEDPPKTEKEDEEEPEDPPAELLYKTDTVLLFKSEKYYYFARVTEDTDTNAKEVPVHIYAAHLREKMGETIAVDQVYRVREMPPGGWGTRSVVVEYFKNGEWTFARGARKMEDHYIVTLEDDEEHRAKLKDVRVPIPVQR